LTNTKEDMNIVVVGHVDHGKSTVIGRLLADTKTLPEGKLEAVQEKCRRNSKPFEYAFLLDALKDEQSQGITIDAARCFFKTEKRNYMIIDAPGHIEFLKNMVTGASRAEAALLVIDALEGIRENSKRHGYMLKLLGIRQIAVVVNKMDLVGYNRDIYENIVEEYIKYLNTIGIDTRNVVFVPVSGINGENLTGYSTNMDWYKGLVVLDILDSFTKEQSSTDKPFRMPVQDVYKFTGMDDRRRIIAGTVETGKICVGDEVVFFPSLKNSHIASVESFHAESKESVSAGYAAAFTLKDQIYVRRGEIAVRRGEPEPVISSRILANVFWLGKNPMETGKEYYLKLCTSKTRVKLERVVKTLDAATLESREKDKIERNDIGECVIELNKEIAFDLQTEILQTGRFVIVDDYEISGGGIIIQALEDGRDWIKDKPYMKSFRQDTACDNVVWQPGKIGYEDRCRLLGQKGLVFWLTGLSGAGKTTIAVELEKRLFGMGKAVYRLDGDNLRQGLNSDLRFSEEDRNENIRRMAEVAGLFKDAAFITIVSAISPYERMRKFARERIGTDSFVEVYVSTPLDECMRRDPKGFYKKARNGQIGGYTGVSDPYEIPEAPELTIDTVRCSLEECVEKCLDYIMEYYGVHE
jgi:bifunctional enzyme CysN/CysC